MARLKKSKVKDVAKFGGVEELGKVQFDGNKHDASNVEAQSQTRLESDVGEGIPVIIRKFTFQMNLEKPELFIERRPTKQDLFNAHITGIEMALWKDGLQVYTNVAPRITFDLKKFRYNIFVTATPARGYILNETPQTLSEILHG